MKTGSMKRRTERFVKTSEVAGAVLGQVAWDKTLQNPTAAKKPASRQGNRPPPAPTQMATRLTWLPQSATASTKAGCGQPNGPQIPPLTVDITTRSASTLAETNSAINSRALLIMLLYAIVAGI